MTLVLGPDGEQTCEECAYAMCGPGGRYICTVAGCHCPCCERDHDYERAERARELDNRHPDKLAVIAADMERERLPTVDELRRERYGLRGWPRAGAA